MGGGWVCKLILVFSLGPKLNNIGCDKEELDFWRLGILKHKKHIEELLSEQQKVKKASSELYAKTCKPRPVPKILDEESYANFYFVFKSESFPSPILYC